MVRIIIEEEGARRAFKLGSGRLSIGSGEAARLRLTSTDVADVHVEVHVGADVVKLVPRPGVVPPEVEGQPCTEEVELALRQAFSIGSARVWFEVDEGDIQGPRTSASSAAPRTTAPTGARVTGRADRSVQREEAIRKAKDGARRSVVQRQTRRVERGLPSWLTATLILGGVVVAVFVLNKIFVETGKRGAGSVLATIQAAEHEVEIGNFETALAKLELLPKSVDPSPEELKRIEGIKAEIKERSKQTVQDVENLKGTNFLDTFLKRYEKNYLQRNPEPAKVRLFLKRTAEFQRRWPTHPDMDWVKRQENRFRGSIDLSAEPTYDDVAWEIESLVDTAPRNYKDAFALLDGYIEGGGVRLSEAEELRAQLVEDRVAYAEDRIQQAKYEYEDKDDHAKCVWWLVHSIIWLGDEELENDAARRLVAVDRANEHILGYENRYPDKFRALLANDIVRAYAKKTKLID